MRISVASLLILLTATAIICDDTVPSVTASNPNSIPSVVASNPNSVPSTTATNNVNNKFLGIPSIITQIQQNNDMNTTASAEISQQIQNNSVSPGNAAMNSLIKQFLTNNTVSNGLLVHVQPEENTKSQNNTNTENATVIPEYFNLTNLNVGSALEIANGTSKTTKDASNVIFPFSNSTLDIFILTNGTNGTANISVSVNQSFNYSLSGNPTTGYEWMIVAPQNLNGQVVNSTNLNNFNTTNDYVVDNQLAGSGGNYTFNFVAETAGVVPITFLYKRPWDTEVAKNYTINTYVQ